MIKFVRVMAVSAGAVFMMFVLRRFAGRRDRRTILDRIRAGGV